MKYSRVGQKQIVQDQNQHLSSSIDLILLCPLGGILNDHKHSFFHKQRRISKHYLLLFVLQWNTAKNGQKVNPTIRPKPSSRGRCLIQYLFTIPIDSVLEQRSPCAKCYVIINSNKLSPRPFPHSPIMNILCLSTTKTSTMDYDNVLGRALGGWTDGLFLLC